MRAFYVRPSDNGNYGVESALCGLGRPVEELHIALFRGFRVPLEPVNFDPRADGLAQLNRYDLVVLAGVDPVVLSPAEQLAVAAFVERGGGLLAIGGSHSFGNAEGTYQLLDPILPVKVLRGLDIEVNAMPAATMHPIARGLPTPLGYVGKVHPVELKPGAQLAMKARDLPLAVAGECGYGRVVVLASYPECDESEYGWFFTGDAFDDFLRSTVSWLRKEQERVWFESFSLPNRQVVVGNEEFGRLKLTGPEAVALQLRTTLTDAAGRTLHDSTASLQPKAAHDNVFAFRVPDDPKGRGVHYVAVSVLDAQGRELARRDVAIEVVNPTRVATELAYGRRAFFPGSVAHLVLHASSDLRQAPDELVADVALLDDGGQPVSAPKRRAIRRRGDAYEAAELALPVPRLRPGSYRLRVELRVGEELADVACEQLHVLASSPNRGEFPLIADGGFHLDRATTDEAVRGLAAAGVNTLSLPGPPSPTAGRGAHREAMLAYAEECAVRAGMALAHHRRRLVPGLSTVAPLSPCALTPEFREALEREVRPLLAAAAKTPALCLQELSSQTWVDGSQLCRCPACQAAFKRNFGSQLPPEDAAALDPAQRRALGAFVTSYWWHAFAAVAKLRDEAAAGVKLWATFDSTSFLRDGPGAPYCDALVWARACDGVEVAAERDLARFRLSLTGHRGIMSSLEKPFGAQLDIAEGALAPAEAAYTAIVHGATSLRVADNPRFLFFKRQPPLGAAVGALFTRLARAAPLLAHTRRPHARVAVLFPFSEVATRDSRELLPAFRLLYDALGEVDILHERLATDEALAPYGAVAIIGAEQLARRAAAAVGAFVERGGLLLADRPQLRDEEGTPAAWPEAFFGESETSVFGAITIRRRRYGAGRTALFSAELAPAYEEAVRAGDSLAARELRRAVEQTVAEHGVRPWARASEQEVEVGIRSCPNTWLLAAVNHSDETRAAQVELDAAAVRATCAFDLATGEPLVVHRQGRAVLTLRLAPRDGGLWVLYPERPFTLRLETPASVRLGGGSLGYKALVLTESGHPAPGRHVVRVCVVDPMGEERPEHGGLRLTTDGVLEASQPFAVNDRPGRWTVLLSDPLTRRAVRRTVEATEDRGVTP